jgi:two-component system, chemotaxis family, CheB/CheR fusion protein
LADEPTSIWLSKRREGAIKLLYIEDNAGVARSMARLLRLHGFDVVSAATRDEAMQHVEIRGLHPDLILTDFELPNGFTGDKIIDEIAARLRFRPPTIMLTSGTGDLHGKVIDVDRILAKPVDIKLLVREIELLLGTGRRRS